MRLAGQAVGGALSWFKGLLRVKALFLFMVRWLCMWYPTATLEAISNGVLIIVPQNSRCAENVRSTTKILVATFSTVDHAMSLATGVGTATARVAEAVAAGPSVASGMVVSLVAVVGDTWSRVTGTVLAASAVGRDAASSVADALPSAGDASRAPCSQRPPRRDAASSVGGRHQAV